MFNVRYKVKDSAKVIPAVASPAFIRKEITSIDRQIKALESRRKKLEQRIRDEHIPLTFFSKSIQLYVLKLEDGCWYVGMSRDVDKRFKNHKKGKGARWTRTHKPISVFEVIDTNTDDDSIAGGLEDDLTIKYAIEYGVDYVRGGGYCQTKPKWPYEVYKGLEEKIQEELALELSVL